MRARYREDKATQVAARLLRLRGGRMSHLKLIKLLYMVEREALLRFARPIINDSLVSMPYGPVVSATLDRINSPELYAADGYWSKYITPKQNNEVSLRDGDDVPNGMLSAADEALIDDVFRKYGHLDRWTLVKLTHDLPEWEDPNGSSTPIDPGTILLNEGFSEEEVAEIRGNWEESALAAALFG
jgi:uncharacterized phage-associated protein